MLKTTFTPDWVSPPGDTIATILEERGISARDFAGELKLAAEAVREILEGRAVLTVELASKFTALSRHFAFLLDQARIPVSTRPVSIDALGVHTPCIRVAD